MKFNFANLLRVTTVFILSSSLMGPLAYALGSEPVVTPLNPPPPNPDEFFEEDPNHLRGRFLEDESGVDFYAMGEASTDQLPDSFTLGELQVSPVAVATGFTHTCAIGDDSKVYCWGDNHLGQLGDNSAVNRPTPTQVFNLVVDVVDISSMHKHTCVLTAVGGVKCWGYNLHGEQGNGTTINNLSPQDVPGLTSGVRQVVAGGFHTCALLDSGDVKCWGANWHGQVGDGSTTTRLTPRFVVDLDDNVAKIYAGKFHTCAIMDTGRVKCWGYNKHGEQGDGTTQDRLTPGSVNGLYSGYISLAPGGLHTCALRDDGIVKCWGDNLEGQLGDGTTTQRLTPVNVNGLAGDVISIKSGAFHTCAILYSGAMQCWGDNWAGQIGDGANLDRLNPQGVAGNLGEVLSFDGGDSHTCVVSQDGRLRCWGSNGYGQIGDTMSGLRLTPADVFGLSSGVASVVTGGLHSCALTHQGGVQCWGNNKYGQIGDGSTIDRVTPTDVVGLASDVVDLAAGVGGFYSCAVTGSGGVKCWGENEKGQLGDGSTNNRLTPVDVAGLSSGVMFVSIGEEHSCVLTTTGGVKCWGENNRGQLGDGTTEDRLTPVSVVGLGSEVVALEAGKNHTCALNSDGQLKCWGNNGFGRLGDGSDTDRSSPVSVVGLGEPIISFTAGARYTCALTSGGGVKCWGSNWSGELGAGTLSMTTRWTPGNVIGLENGVISINSGGNHTCALMEDTQVKCWGSNSTGQLGDNTTEVRSEPVNVLELSAELVRVRTGSQHTCGITIMGAVLCWGANIFGQVGDGSFPWYSTPHVVLGLPMPALVLHQTTGMPGSYFTVDGAYFPADRDATITINGTQLTPTVPIDEAGEFQFVLTTNEADEGEYFLTVSAIFNLTARFIIAQGEPLYPPNGVPVRLAVPPGIAFDEWSFIPIATR